MSPDRSTWQPTFTVLTCEHGGNEVPAAYRRLFRNAAPALRSHQGYDPGALAVAWRMASHLAAPLVSATTTRLLIDLNRSLGNPQRFSPFTRDLPEPQKQAIERAYHRPYWRRVETLLSALLAAGQRVLHVGVHSCIDELDGEARQLDVALLFDPQRPSEAAFCRHWQRRLIAHRPAWRCPFNQPYLGAADGLTTWLRTCFPAAAYAGVEIEVRQGLIATRRAQRQVADVLAATLAEAE